MALISCPECGKVNISDSAVSCPKCGYAIKEHYEREKRIKQFEEVRLQLDERKREEAQKLKSELDKKLAAVDRMPYPEKPTFMQALFDSKGGGSGLSYATVIALIASFLLGFLSYIFIVIFALLLVLWVPFWIWICYADYKSALSMYEEKTRNFKKYKEDEKARIRKDYDSYAYNMATHGSRTTPMPQTVTQSNQLKCPICGSTNVSKISTLNRSVSVATVGLASSKIGKQYECKSCKHKW